MTDRVSWRNSQVLSLLVLVFISGALSGVFAFRMIRMAMRKEAPQIVLVNLANKESSLNVFQRELELTPGQLQKVSAILDDYKRYYENIQDQLEELRATGKNRIVEVLGPTQREKFEKLTGGAAAKVTSSK